MRVMCRYYFILSFLGDLKSLFSVYSCSASFPPTTMKALISFVVDMFVFEKCERDM